MPIVMGYGIIKFLKEGQSNGFIYFKYCVE